MTTWSVFRGPEGPRFHRDARRDLSAVPLGGTRDAVDLPGSTHRRDGALLIGSSIFKEQSGSRQESGSPARTPAKDVHGFRPQKYASRVNRVAHPVESLVVVQSRKPELFSGKLGLKPNFDQQKAIAGMDQELAPDMRGGGCPYERRKTKTPRRSLVANTGARNSTVNGCYLIRTMTSAYSVSDSISATPMMNAIRTAPPAPGLRAVPSQAAAVASP